MEMCDCSHNSVHCACNKSNAVEAKERTEGSGNDLRDAKRRILAMYQDIKNLFV